MRFAYAYAILGAALLWVAAITAYAIANRAKAVPSPLKKYAPCVEWIVGPSPEFVCANGHGYLLQDGRFRDLGRGTPVPRVPVGQ